MNIQRAYVEITNLCNLHCDFCAGHHLSLIHISEPTRPY